MDGSPKEIRIFERANGSRPFSDWMDEARCRKSPVQRVHELKIGVGPGFRIYFGTDGDFVILLGGGRKVTQVRDIEAAKECWREYNA